MAAEVLAPGMEDGDHAEVAVEPFGVVGERLEGRPDALKQQAVDHLGVQVDPRVELMRQGEHQVKIGHRQ